MKHFACFGIAAVLAGCAAEQTAVPGKPAMTVTPEFQKEARYACYDEAGSVAALRPLLEQGFPVNHVVNEYGQTLLHVAAEMGNRPLVRFLLANGADIMAGDRDGNRPIDAAYAEKHWDVCRLLALKSPPRDATLEGIPAGVWEVAFREQFRIRNSDGTRFLVLHVGGKPVSDGLAKWMFEQRTNVGANNYFEDVDQGTGLKIWRDAMTGEDAVLCWFAVEKLSSNHYRVTMNSQSGPSECRWFGICEARNKYGYWLGEWIGSGHVFAPGKKKAGEA
jgi:uncharacterized protein YodC (DUF2158 family)